MATIFRWPLMGADKPTGPRADILTTLTAQFPALDTARVCEHRAGVYGIVLDVKVADPAVVVAVAAAYGVPVRSGVALLLIDGTTVSVYSDVEG